MATPERCFALFDDEVRRLKLVRMSEIQPEPDTVILLSPYTVTGSSGKVNVALSTEKEPMLKRIPLPQGKHIYLWRSPWCMYYEASKCWITILDSDKRKDIPGNFPYSVSYTFYNPWYAEYMSLRKTMMATVESLEKEAAAPLVRMLAPSAPPALPDRKPPAFVAAIIKRDAIANGLACPVSLEGITEKMKVGITPCFHLFEADSLIQWIDMKGFCPTCMCALTSRDCLLL